MKQLPNWLILVGTNRNAGKTSLACRIIKKFSGLGVTAIKISPHFHPLGEGEKVVRQGEDYLIIEEIRSDTGKDSSRMLSAGASRVYYVQVWDNRLEKAVNELLEILDPHTPVICESGWIRNLIDPGAFLILSRSGQEDRKESIGKLKDLDHCWVNFDGEDFDLDTVHILFEQGRWKLT